MPSRVAQRISWIILAAAFSGTLMAYPFLPLAIATHFAADGTPNGTTSTSIGAFIIPLVMVFVLSLFAAIPYIDPLRVNIQYFRRQYDTLVALLMLFFACAQAAIIAWNLGFKFDQMYVVLPAAGILVFYLGVILPQTRCNWFVGIRTPWTISSDRVWQKTHELGGRLFKVLGVIILLGIFAPSYAFWVILLPLVIVALGLVLYSYVLYEQDRTA